MYSGVSFWNIVQQGIVLRDPCHDLKIVIKNSYNFFYWVRENYVTWSYSGNLSFIKIILLISGNSLR